MKQLLLLLLIVGCRTFEDVYDPICIKENCYTNNENLTTCSLQCYPWKWHWQNETETCCEVAIDGILNQEYENCYDFCENNRCADVVDSTDTN